MVRAILAPKSPEAQFIRRVRQGNDGGLVRAVLAPPHIGHNSVVRVCLCEDGRLGVQSCWQSVHQGLRDLYALWGMSVRCDIYRFSFLDEDPDAMADLLKVADVFFFAGVHSVHPKLEHAMLKPAGPTRQSLVTLLQERIQYNHCAFFGVCGGAMMSGATNCYGLPGLDLFDGLTVKYDCNVSASAVSVDTSYKAGLLQMTTGCALALVMTKEEVSGISFTTVKNQAQWWSFAESNTTEVQRLVQKKCEDWKTYHHNGERWYFNLRGFLFFENSATMYSVKLCSRDV